MHTLGPESIIPYIEYEQKRINLQLQVQKSQLLF